MALSIIDRDDYWYAYDDYDEPARCPRCGNYHDHYLYEALAHPSSLLASFSCAQAIKLMHEQRIDDSGKPKCSMPSCWNNVDQLDGLCVDHELSYDLVPNTAANITCVACHEQCDVQGDLCDYCRVEFDIEAGTLSPRALHWMDMTWRRHHHAKHWRNRRFKRRWCTRTKERC